jgi:hypothetical protein
MDSTIEPGATADSAAMSRLTRRSPVSVMPSLVSPYAAASPAAIVTPRPARTGLAPGIQAMARMAAGYPGSQTRLKL